MNVKYTESLETRVEKLEKALKGKVSSGKTITVERDFFEHLLNCMANQKYLPTLGASNHMSEREKEHQKVIDTAYHKARELLSPMQGEEPK